MDAAVVEAVPPATFARTLCSLAVPLEIARAAIRAHVVFAGHVEGFAGTNFTEDLICRVELGGLRELGDIARMEEKRWLNRERVDLADRRAKSRADVRVGGLVEPDVTVADLHEEELSLLWRLCAEPGRARDATTDRPQETRSYPSHAAQEVAPIDAVLVELRIVWIRVRIACFINALDESCRVSVSHAA